jgi:hypothetical protein
MGKERAVWTSIRRATRVRRCYIVEVSNLITDNLEFYGGTK